MRVVPTLYPLRIGNSKALCHTMIDAEGPANRVWRRRARGRAVALVGLLSCWLPARRAARLAPSDALRD
jgi:hypothetical protein